MIMIFSNVAIEGLHGAYRNPKFYDGNFEKAKIVYTDIEEIAKQAEEKGLQVFALNSHPPSQEVIESATVKDEPIVFDIVSETAPATFTTTVEEDIEAGMSNEAIIAKHGIEKKELTKVKRKLTMAKKKK